ncbi:hypothetical protein [Sorangium sp. So ce394]|uniref:hypothetical protein n=1 Tax=Sorangium sp. So ce394 TaxID=3133310 RepID=UPI003F5B0B84
MSHDIDSPVDLRGLVITLWFQPRKQGEKLLEEGGNDAEPGRALAKRGLEIGGLDGPILSLKDTAAARSSCSGPASARGAEK